MLGRLALVLLVAMTAAGCYHEDEHGAGGGGGYAEDPSMFWQSPGPAEPDVKPPSADATAA